MTSKMPPASARARRARRAAVALSAALACLLMPAAFAQTPAAKEAPASVEGRVTDGADGLAGVVVTLLKGEPEDNRPPRTLARTKTDHEGRYRLSGVQPGSYFVMPMAPLFVLPETRSYPPGRRLMLGAGETVADVDFRLTRGGVITGRVTDADGQPVIAEAVIIAPADEKTAQMAATNYPQHNQTDDRGVYRIYGLAPGRYLVSVGRDAESGGVRVGGPGRFYPRTFHPSATDKSQARVVELASGGEATDVDITVGRAARTYKATGRLLGVDGRPAPGASLGYGPLDHEGQQFTQFRWGIVTNSRGEFVVEGLPPGRYALFAMPLRDRPGENYSDPAPFEIDDADVTGLELRLRRGTTVSGVVQIEGASDPATLARLFRQLSLYSQVEPTAGVLTTPSFAETNLAPDGSFRLTGLRPGRLRLGVHATPAPPVVLSRIELNGVVQRDGVEIGEGVHVAGLRVVLSYGNSVVRGQVNLLNGTLPPGARLAIFARRLDATGGGELPYDAHARGAEADARGRFVLTGLIAGNYEVTARLFMPYGGEARQSQPAQVAVPEGGEATATLTLDLRNR